MLSRFATSCSQPVRTVTTTKCVVIPLRTLIVPFKPNVIPFKPNLMTGSLLPYRCLSTSSRRAYPTMFWIAQGLGMGAGWFGKSSERRMRYAFYSFVVFSLSCMAFFEKSCPKNPLSNEKKYFFPSHAAKELMKAKKAEPKFYQESTILPADDPESKRVSALLERIVKGNWHSCDEMREIDWKVHVRVDKEESVCSFENGVIYVNSGLLENKASDAEVGFLIAREVASTLSHQRTELHSYMTHMTFGSFWFSFVFSFFFPVPVLAGAFLALNYTARLKYEKYFHQGLVYFNDRYGLIFAARACLDVKEIPLYMEMMERKKQREAPPLSLFKRLHYKIWEGNFPAIPTYTQRCTLSKVNLKEALKNADMASCPRLPKPEKC